MPHDVEKPVLQYQIDRELVAIRDVFVCIISHNSYEPANADKLDMLLDLAYRSGEIAGAKRVITLLAG